MTSRTASPSSSGSSTPSTPSSSTSSPKPATPNAWSGLGIRSLTHWLTWKAGVTNERANALVRLAAAQTTHPELSTLFADGQLTVDQAAVAVKVEPRHDHRVAEMAPLATVNQLRTIVRCSLPATPPPADPERPAAPEPTDTVSTWTGDDGRFHLHADLSADQGHIVDAALRAARDRLRQENPGARITWVDALLDMAERSVGAEARPAASGSGSTCSSTRPRRSRQRGPTARRSPTSSATTSRATGCSARSSRPMPTPPPSAAPSASSPSASADSSCTAITPAACPGAAPATTSTSTTSSTGSAAGTPSTRTSSRSAAAATAPTTTGCWASPATPSTPTASCSPTASAASSPANPAPCRPPAAARARHPYEHALGERMDTRSVGAVFNDPPQHAPPSAGAA